MNIINDRKRLRNIPQEVNKFIAKDKKNKKNYSFIWLPKKLLSSENFVTEEKTNFFWNLIHELQHLKQDAHFGTQILKVNSFLREALIYNSCPPKIDYVDLPAEFDAYKKAKEIIVIKYGNELFSNFLKFKKEKLLKKTKNDKSKFLNLIQKIDVKMNYCVKNESLKLIKNNKDFLNKKLTEFNSTKNYFSIDIDAICEAGDVCFIK